MATNKKPMAESVGVGERTFAKIEGVKPRKAKPKGTPSDAATTVSETSEMSALPAIWASDWLKTVSDNEVVSFYQLRLRKDFETLASMTLCRTPQEVGAVWMGAVSAAAQDYAGLFSSVFRPSQDN